MYAERDDTLPDLTGFAEPAAEASAADPAVLLADTFGFSGFRAGQREIVDRLIAGTHTLCVMPTGAGKSLCYQLPALVFDRPTIVVSPLVALIDDQVAALRANGVDAAGIHSNRPRADNVADWRRFQAGAAKLLYLSPERLMTERMLDALARLDPAMFVVDEAHCISKWGVSFRPEYEALAALKQRFPRAVMAAFTATADAATRTDIAAKLFGGAGDIVVHGFDRPNLRLGVAPKTEWKRQLLDFLDGRRDEAGIVYCLSRRLTEEVAALLAGEGFRALPYHAGLAPEVRAANQQAFMAEQGVVMVATIAFGMGIDKPDIRYVFHLNLPGSVEAYYQEIGRAGRDGGLAEVAMVYGLDDIRLRRQFIDQDGEDEDHRRREHKRLDALLAYCEATQCRRVALLACFGDDAEPCGNCDTCLDPPEMIDGTAEAKALFEAVAGTGESFGTAHIIDVLRGGASEKLIARGHDRLAVYGVGKERPKPFWQAFIRQAVAGGYLAIDIERFGGLRLTQKGRAVRAGGEEFRYRAIAEAPAKAPRRRAGSALPEGLDEGLYAALKGLRRELAEARGVPAYVIFADATLQDMCVLRPATRDQFALVNGVGPKKLADFADAFLAAIRGHDG
jgi:ATP-dependent DNA helicase RecQ